METTMNKYIMITTTFDNKEEDLGITINKQSLEFIGATTSEVFKEDMKDNHYNEYYVVHADLDINDIILQREEVQNIKWFAKEELIKKINNNYEDLTGKLGCWNYLLKYFEIKEKNK